MELHLQRTDPPPPQSKLSESDESKWRGFIKDEHRGVTDLLCAWRGQFSARSLRRRCCWPPERPRPTPSPAAHANRCHPVPALHAGLHHHWGHCTGACRAAQPDAPSWCTATHPPATHTQFPGPPAAAQAEGEPGRLIAGSDYEVRRQRCQRWAARSPRTALSPAL